MAKHLDLPHHYRQHLETLLREHLPTVEVWAYGSRVNGQSLDGSDLDLVLRSPDLQPIPVDSLASFSEALRASPIPFLVAAHDWARLPESCHPEIEREHLVLVAADSRPLDQQNSDIGNGWCETTLGDITDFLSGGTPSKSRPDYWNGSVPWVSAKDMKRFRLHDTEDHVTAEGIANGTKLVPADTVLLLVRGMTLLKELPVCVTGRPMTFNQDIKALRPKPGVDLAFLPYLVLSHKRRLLRLVDLAGHGTGRLNSEELKSLKVRLPPEDEQRTIAQILGTLDDKIELNRQLNETLEELVRAIFKDWFVDFGPVRAKLEGRDTGLPEQLAELFPDRLVESELGEIPEGWQALPAGKAATVRGGTTPSTKEPAYWGGEHCFATPKDLSLLREPVLASTARRLTDAGVARIRSGLLPPGTLLFSSRAPIGYLAMTTTPVAINQGIIALICDGPVGAPYALNWIRSNMVAIEARASGTTFLEISKSSFREIPLLVPSESIHAAYESLVVPLYDLVAVKAQESRSLAALRDALLPKLVSGEVRTHIAPATNI